MGFPNLYSVSGSCLTDDDHTLGHFEILLPGVSMGKPFGAKARGKQAVTECKVGVTLRIVSGRISRM